MCERKWKKLELHVGYTKRKKKGLVVTWGICGWYRHYNISLSGDTLVWRLFSSLHFQQPSRSVCWCTGVPNNTVHHKRKLFIQWRRQLTIFHTPPHPTFYTLGLNGGVPGSCGSLRGPRINRDWTRQCKKYLQERIYEGQCLFTFFPAHTSKPWLRSSVHPPDRPSSCTTTPQQQAQSCVFGQCESHLCPTIDGSVEEAAACALFIAEPAESCGS